VWDEGLAQPDSRRTIPREGTQAPARVARDDRHLPRNHWRGDWRRDNRYDWRRHRDRNRSLFRVGIYFDPFGWDYRRHHVGWRLWPDYYSRSYWLNDPWMYRLPQAFPGTRWIRYHGDAVLVDTWTGEVVDIIHDFFW
jgi:Ni/Co efflux regulator RcnB